MLNLHEMYIIKHVILYLKINIVTFIQTNSLLIPALSYFACHLRCDLGTAHTSQSSLNLTSLPSWKR